MKQFKYAILTLSTIAALSALCLKHSSVSERESNSLLMENIEALTLYETPDGKIIIEDKVPCASSANEVMIHFSYVNCTTCRSEKGEAKGLDGVCTVIRVIDPNDF